MAAARGRDAPIGGQAVLEGVMMRGVRTWSVAVRAPTAEQLERAEREVPVGEIAVQTFPFSSALRRHRWLRLPLLRGVVALGGSLAIGMRALNISANAQLGTAAQIGAAEEEDEGGGLSGAAWVGALVVSFAFAVGLFFVLPVGIVSLIKSQLHSSTLFWLIEGVVRTAIFLGYLLLLSRLRELRRVFEYHGAEHKTIACHEAGRELTPENAATFSRLHPRCGTSFLLIVMIVAIFVFAPIGLPAWYWLLLTRILGVPVIAGISFEIIKLAARYRDHRWVRAVMAPGLALQRLTTREPDLSQLAVAIAALRSVLDVEAGDGAGAADLVGLEVVA
ncbi:MAG TPA: DUF1385 domain-containing protein [Solirubrobacteraceae bacterium]|nr:DUF1385 domain-containing protein [Solirubrobacteraceae bacterium]